MAPYSNKKQLTLSPSQILNIPLIALGIVTIQLGIFALLALVRVLEFYFWRYEFYERTLVERKGILNVTRKELHYYRIKSVYWEEPFIYRIFGLSNIYIKTSDPYLPELKLFAISKGREIKELLESLTFEQRGREKVREIDFHNL